MKIFEFFLEGFVHLLWLILLFTHTFLLICGDDYSASNNSIVTFIIIGLLQMQITIKSEIQKLKDKL